MSRLQETAAAIRMDVVRDRVLDFPRDVQAALINEWRDKSETGDDPHHRHLLAGLQLQRRVETLSQAHARIAFDDDRLTRKARRMAHLCVRAGRLERMELIASDANVNPPDEKKLPRVARENRLKCEKWWRRKLRRHYSRRAEGELRELGLVRKGRGLYCSDATLNRRRDQKQRGREILQQILATNDAGEAFTLLELAKTSLSNPELRRAELMVRIRGFEECAEAAGHVGEFYTFTTPSRFHAWHSKGKKNARYQDGLSPRESQAWLCACWQKIRAKLARLSIRIYGFRVAEPHHDGTTHWHLLVFAPRHHAATVRAVCRSYLLADSGNESGAFEHRFKAVRINPAMGTAAGYVAKYVAKNIDGFSVGPDLEDGNRDASATAPRVDAWASTWGIRQFQQIGGPPVGLWRELRRIRDEIRPDGVYSPHKLKLLETARQAADAGEWRTFVDILGGPTRNRDAIPIALEKELTGECTEYGEPRAAAIVGVRCSAIVVMTRLTRWLFSFLDAVGGAWTRVNNCTAAIADEYERFLQECDPPTKQRMIAYGN